MYLAYSSTSLAVALPHMLEYTRPLPSNDVASRDTKIVNTYAQQRVLPRQLLTSRGDPASRQCPFNAVLRGGMSYNSQVAQGSGPGRGFTDAGSREDVKSHCSCAR